MFKNDIVIYGKYAEYLKKYSHGTSSEEQIDFKVNNNVGKQESIYIFETLMDAFLIAAMLGIIENREIKYISSGEPKATIFAEKVIKTKKSLDRIIEFMILTDENIKNVDDKVKQTFTVRRTEEEKKMLETRLKGFAQGGLEIINEEFEPCESKEAVIFKINDLCNRYDLIEYEER